MPSALASTLGLRCGTGLGMTLLLDQQGPVQDVCVKKPYWETKTLAEMTAQEWESLCDGCGLCCVIRFEDEETGEVIPTRVHCRLFDPQTCRCSDYANRKRTVPDCIKLTPHNIEALEWMPRSCAYRRLHEGKDLPLWHPLLTGDPDSTHKAGVSIRRQTVSELALSDPEEALDFAAWDLTADFGDLDYDPDYPNVTEG